MSKSRTSVQRCVLTLLLLALLAGPSAASWSVMIVDLATGEVAIASAVCLAGWDLVATVPVIVPGVGVAAHQNYPFPPDLKRHLRDHLVLGTPPAQIIALRAQSDSNHEGLQYGILTLENGSAFHIGNALVFPNALPHIGNISGQTGSLAYMIQANFATGPNVLTAAEQAIISTPGDISQKLMAAMNAAATNGGDGRCTCTAAAPMSCGSPPPNFTKAAQNAFMIISRPGDIDAPCGSFGCASGTYYMKVNIANQGNTDPDPIAQLQTQYNATRATLVGRPDHFQSTVTMNVLDIPANGTAQATARIELRDLLGNPITTGGALVTCASAPESDVQDAMFSPALDNGDGTYDVTVTAGTVPGIARLRIVVDDGSGPVQLGPDPLMMFSSPFGGCGDGTTNSHMGPPVDVLTINGSAGVERVVQVAVNEPITFEMALPPALQGSSTPADFILWAGLGIPQPTSEFFVSGLGTLCMTPPPLPGSGFTFTLANTWGDPVPELPANPAPWSFTIPGIDIGIDLALQGVIVHDSPFQLAITNALLLRVVPYPAPTIESLSDRFAPAGQTVTVAGTGFLPNLTIDIDGSSVTPTSVQGEAIDFFMPAGVACDASLTITNPDGKDVATAINPSPLVTGTAFETGPTSGLATFVLIGHNFEGSSVTIGGTNAIVLSSTDELIQVLTPPGAPGAATVVVTSPRGCTGTATYTYQ